MLIPLKTDRPQRNRPIANWVIIGLNIVCFALQRSVPQIESTFLLWPGDPGLAGIFGHAFLHGGILHLLSNMLFLYIFGNAINDALGNAAYVGFYLAGAAAAATLHLLVSDSPVLGASGAVSACSAAFLCMFPRSRIYAVFFLFIITTIVVPAFWFVGLFLIIDLFSGLDQAITGHSDGVARWAHLGGSAFGIIAALLLMKLNLVHREKFDGLAILARRKRRMEFSPTVIGQTHYRAHDIVPVAAQNPVDAKAQQLRGDIQQAFDDDQPPVAAEKYLELLRVDPRQVLSLPQQIIVARHLQSAGRHAEAATVYELLLERHANPDRVKRPDDLLEAAQIRLMLGLIYARYLAAPERAKHHLGLAEQQLRALDAEADADFAAEELKRLAS